MVTYGPWIQDPDYDQLRTYTQYATFDNRYLGDFGGHFFSGRPPTSEPYLVTIPDLTAALIAAKTPPGGEIEDPFSHGVEFGYGQGINTVVPLTYLANWSATYMRAKWRIAPDPGGYGYNPPNNGNLDPDAIALQYEGSEPVPTSTYGASSIVGVHLDALTQIVTRIGDSTGPGSTPVYANLGGGWSTGAYIRPEGEGADYPILTIPGSGLMTEPNSLTTTLGVDVDLTDLLEPFDWSGTIWTETPAQVVPNYMPTNPEEGAAGTLKYGWLLKEPHVVYSVRPPRYRWVYPGGGAYRRTFPRDDGLAGGAPRTFPQSKASQSSNRTFGGFL